VLALLSNPAAPFGVAHDGLTELRIAVDGNAVDGIAKRRGRGAVEAEQVEASELLLALAL
jgi:hypothetical protein